MLKLNEIKPSETRASGLDIVWAANDISSIPRLDEFGPAIAGLGSVRTGGLRCEYEPKCTFVGSEARRVREHFREAHSWEPNTKAGRPQSCPTQAIPCMLWRSDVRYQRLFIKSPRSDYFEVERNRQAVVEDVANDEQRSREIREAIVAFRTRTAHPRQQEAEETEEQFDVRPPNAWLRRLGAAQHLKEFSAKKDFLLRLISLENKVQGAN